MASACESPSTEATLTEPQKGLPHSDLVGVPSPARQTPLSPSKTAFHPSSGSPPHKPLRSPLRPPARSISSKSSAPKSRSSTATQDSLDTPPSSAIDDTTIIVDPTSPEGGYRMTDRNSFQTIDELLAEVNAMDSGNILSKSLAARPDSPPTRLMSRAQAKSESSSSSSSLPAQVPPQPSMTKRQHALHELLSSERAYASDLSLIREVHIPLALGQTVPLQNLPASPPDSSASSSRTLSTASDSSTASLGPPMSQEDARTIFTNIAELAVFSDSFCDQLEEALGSLVEGGVGKDHVGELFLQIIPDLEKPYQFYITKHPGALQHLQNLPQTPALQAYMTYTRSIASSVSHAWDLASLLIKPVQRLLKYPLLLSAIIDETPDDHPDKENLKQARAMMEEVARNVNEVRRRAEVIKDVLTSKKKPVNVTVAASVNLGKMKNLRIKTQPVDENSEAAHVERMSQELKRIELFAQQFAKNIVDWARSMSKVVGALRAWALGFGKVIGLSPEQGSEAFEAFLAVVEQQLMPLCVDLEAIINERLLREIAHLLKSMNQPYKLLASMSEQEPLHYHLLNMNVSAKNRPPPTLLAASTNYLALRAQLAAELPTYLALLHQGLAFSVRRLADIQMRFWKDVKDRWGELWEMLRVDGELNAGHEETVIVWRSRWMDVDEVLASLNINQARKIYQEPERIRTSAPPGHPLLSNMEHTSLPPNVRKHSTNTVSEMLSSLEPHQSATYSSHQAQPVASSRSRGRDSAPDDVSYRASKRPSRRNSNESMHGRFRASKGKSPARKVERDESFEYVYPELPINHHHYESQPSTSYHPNHKNLPGGFSTPNLPRRKSMPLSSDSTSSSGRRATSPSYGGSRHVAEEPIPTTYHNHPYGTTAVSRDSYASERSGRSGDVSRSATGHKKSMESSTKSQRPSHSRNRSGSITSFFKGDKDNRDREQDSPVPNLPEPDSRYMSHSNRDSWVTKPAKYVCHVIHPCQPPAAVSYFSFPFFTLVNGDLYEVLQEAGHPSIHPKLPLYVDDGEDCLLLCRDTMGNVGWALASFLEPLKLSR